MTKKQAKRFILLHKELWQACADRSARIPERVTPQVFTNWLRAHRGVYAPVCREYLAMLDEMVGKVINA